MPQVSIEQALRIADEHLKHARPADAEKIYAGVVRAAPREPTAVYRLGILAGIRRDWVAAERWLSQAVELLPEDAGAAKDYGQVLAELRRFDVAVPWFERAAQLAPGEWEIRFRLAMAYDMRGGKGDQQRAVEAYREVLRIDPGCAEAHNNLGNLLQKQGTAAALSDAMEHFRRAAERPGYLDPVVNIGSALAQARQHEEAIQFYQQGLGLCPPQEVGRSAVIWRNLGTSMAAVGQQGEAEGAFREALRRVPNYVEAWSGLGDLLVAAGRLDEALEAFRQAEKHAPASAETLGNLGVVLAQMARHEDAISYFRRALAIDPSNSPMHSRLIGSLLYAEAATAEGILTEARAWDERHGKRFGVEISIYENVRDPERRLRIGYVSPDFREHCQAMFLIPLFAHHDASQVEVVAYSDVRSPDATTASIRGHCHAWRDVSALDDSALARQVREDRIDVLIDLTMHMVNNRLQMFAKKPAPVQVTWLAYPGTTGVSAIDYRITDPHLDPPGETESLYSETSICLPETFWCYDPLMADVDVNELPASSKGYVTFGCLNNFTKLNTHTLQRWGGVLRQVPGSRLMLLVPAGSCREWILKTLAAQGIGAERIDFRGLLPRAQYLAQYHDMDIGFDTLPYNGHTTSLDAFWMGVPVVTMMGDRVVGRAGLSQLANLDMAELIGRTDVEFTDLAVALANDLARQARYRRELRPRMTSSALMDGTTFARNMERAYRRMWDTWCRKR